MYVVNVSGYSYQYVMSREQPRVKHKEGVEKGHAPVSHFTNVCPLFLRHLSITGKTTRCSADSCLWYAACLCIYESYHDHKNRRFLLGITDRYADKSV